MTKEDKSPHWMDQISGDLLTRVREAHKIANGSLDYRVGLKLAWSSNSKENGGNYAYPVFKVYDRWEAYTATLALMTNGYNAIEDLYIDDDGDDCEGRPITREIWSVRLPDIKMMQNEAKTGFVEIEGIGATYNPEI